MKYNSSLPLWDIFQNCVWCVRIKVSDAKCKAYMIFTFVGYQEHFPRNACQVHYSEMRLKMQTKIVIINIKCVIVRYTERCNATKKSYKHIPFIEVLSL